MKARSSTNKDEMRAEYDFDYTTAVRGKYCKRLLNEGANIVVLEPYASLTARDSQVGAARSDACVGTARKRWTAGQ